ncbi:tyrosine-type recombinase/integrase [Georgenia wangjunii]|uniref:tyrosine-type recombinase/integrase n=1 Tax=Georgenia wangjunii TaxID=3117730 RepID=UPI002F263F4D
MVALGTFATRAEADDAIAVAQAGMATGTWHDTRNGDRSLAEYIDHLIDTRGELRDRTRALYRRLLTEWVDAPLQSVASRGAARVVHLGARHLSDLASADIREWHAAVQAEARRRAVDRHHRAQTSPKQTNSAIRTWARTQGHTVADTGRISAHLRDSWERAGSPAKTPPTPPPMNAGSTETAQAYRLVHMALAHAVEDGLIRANPCKIKNAGQGDERDRAERVPATAEQVARIADHMPDRYRAAIWVAALSGLRAGELFALQRKHVDLRSGELRVVQALEAPGNGRLFGPVKSAAGRRTVTISEPALSHLAAHMDEFTGPDAESLIFATASGRPLSGGHRTKMFTRAREAAGRPDLHWHDLRHTGAVFAAKVGATLPELQARFGHASARAALRYQHVLPGADSRIAEAIALLFDDEAEHPSARPVPESELTIAEATPAA